ncbi:small ubiquitin-related modifier 1 [Grus japonensis]|uniref:NFATC2-interacting protein n=1 Tax=Grus japonensis TaxID=30415 RepID=A0ABC9Y0T7_GRUJA
MTEPLSRTQTGVTGDVSSAEEDEDDARRPRPLRRPPPKRPRLGPHVPSAPVYSDKVNRCFPLCPTAELTPPPGGGDPPIDVDADDDSAGGDGPLPPPPVSPPGPPRYRSSRTRRIIKDVDERLRGLSGLVGEGQEVSSPPPPASPPSPPPSPPLWLKVRCRGRVHRVPLRRRDPLRGVQQELGGALGVPPGRILLLRRDQELEPSDTPQGLGLGVADILECVVLRLHVPKAEPLRGAMERYRAARGMGGRPLTFLFEGRKLGGGCTPEELGMEQDDVIEVWG